MNQSFAKAFYAYASAPDVVAKNISDAITQINNSTGEIKIQDWRNMNVIGKPIIDMICEHIDNSDLFICDLTTHNHNVLFELGYAIAKNKKIWITLNPNHHDSAKRYRDLRLITTIGYTTFINSYELAGKFFSDNPHLNDDPTILDRHEGDISNSLNRRKSSLFHMKSKIQTAESIELERELRRGKLTIIQEDPTQATGQSLSWYLENTYHSASVLVHLSPTNGEDLGQDAKYSLAAGIAFGFNRPLLVLAHSPFQTPIDYRDITIEHTTSQECVGAYKRWIDKIVSSLEEQTQTKTANLNAIGDIRRIDIGHYLAENEKNSVDNYFIETTAYEDALNSSDYLLFVGRKGTGKTANFLVLAETMNSYHENHVCLIHPLKYEFEGIFRLFGLSSSVATRSYLLQSIWKFLIYTELANSVFNEITNRPNHIVMRENEQQLINFVEANENIIRSDFSERLEYAIREICELDVFDGTHEQKIAISEILHEKVIGKLRRFLGEILGEKEKVSILVDNLDEGWEQRDDLPQLSNFLFGLISISRNIASDFKRERRGKPGINLSIIIFLREDIFAYIKRQAQEADKLVYSQIRWDDKELLLQVVEERFAYSIGEEVTPGEIWKNFFVEKINEVTTSNYIMNRIIPRPRDIIYLCRAALVKAKARKHSMIEVNDILDAELEYSKFAIALLLTEIDKEFPSITSATIYEFIGECSILTIEEIEKRLRVSKIPDEELAGVVNIMIQNNFFAPETMEGIFTFIFDEDNKDKILVKSRKLVERIGMQRYKIHPAFHPALEIVEI